MLFITEKPAISYQIIKHLNITDSYYFSINSFLYEFDYSDYSFLSEVKYKMKNDYSVKYKLMHFDGKNTKNTDILFDTENNINRLLNFMFTQNEICLIFDNDHTGIRGKDILLNSLLKIIDIDLLNLSSFYSLVFDANHTRSGFINRFSSKYNLNTEKNRNIYKKKDYIDFHFNFIIKEKYSINLTRNMFYLLSILNDIDASLNINKKKIGSPASQRPIIDFLSSVSFICGEGYKYNITSLGKLFMSNVNSVLKDTLMYESLYKIVLSEKAFHEVKNEIDDYLLKIKS